MAGGKTTEADIRKQMSEMTAFVYLADFTEPNRRKAAELAASSFELLLIGLRNALPAHLIHEMETFIRTMRALANGESSVKQH